MHLLKQVEINGIITLLPLQKESSCAQCGADDFLILNPLTGEPYMPGSIISGRIQKLLFDYFENKKINSPQDDKLLFLLFPPMKTENEKEQKPARLVVRDALPVDGMKISILPEESEKNPFEIIKLMATGEMEKFLEQILPLDFKLRLGLRIYEDSEKRERELLDIILLGLKLLAQKGLSKCGKISLRQLEVDGAPITLENTGLLEN